MLKPARGLQKQNIVLRWLHYYGLVTAILVFGIYGKGYTRADFVYMNFLREEICFMKEKVRQVLAQECPGIDFEATDALIDDGILDSLGITASIAALSMGFGIVIPYEEIIEENFNSLDAMTALVERLQR